MSFANAVVSGVLQSPLHRLLSGSFDLIRYTGRRSGRQIITPTMYARRGDDVIVLVGHPEKKTWWRNFTEQGNIEMLLQRQWVPMTARAVIGAEDIKSAEPLVHAYLARFPRSVGALGAEADGSRTKRAVVILCQPR